MPELPQGKPSLKLEQDATKSSESLAEYSETFKQLLAHVSEEYDRLHLQAVKLTSNNDALLSQLWDLGVVQHDDPPVADAKELQLDVTMTPPVLEKVTSSPTVVESDPTSPKSNASGEKFLSGSVLQVHSVWNLGASSRRLPTSPTQGTDFEALAQSVHVSGDAVKGRTCLSRFIIHPSSPSRVIWDAFTIIILAYDIFMVPYQVFDPPRTALLKTLEWVSTIFWTLDVFISFTTGFYKDSLVEMRPSKIAARYVKSWLLFDLIVLVADWLTRLAGSAVSGLEGLQLARIGKSLRVMRVLRSLRLLRILKLSNLLHEVMDNIKSEYIRKSLEVFGLLICLIVFSHFIACAWYIVGDLQDSPMSWVSRTKVNQGGDVFYRYVASLHWALSQFALTSMDVFAGSTSERVFAIFVLLLALVFFSSFVSNITTSMGVILRLNRDAKNQQMSLRQYFNDNRISADLASRIMFFLKAKHYSKRRNVHERDIPVLKLLPEVLLAQLHAEAFLPSAIAHPFFWQLKTLDWVGICELCHHTMSEHPLESREVLFTAGNAGTRMFFVISGDLAYYRELHEVVVENSQWLSEGTLWMKWFHCGKAIASTTSELVELDAEKFQRVMLNRPRSTVQPAKRYARQFLSRVRAHHEELSDLTLEFDLLQEMAQIAFHEDPETGGAVSDASCENFPRTGSLRASNSSQMTLARHRTIDPERRQHFAAFNIFSNSSLWSGSSIWRSPTAPQVRGRLRWMR